METGNIKQTPIMKSKVEETFGRIWHSEYYREFGMTPETFEILQEQALAVLGCDDMEELKDLLSGGKKILDAGCGVGWFSQIFNFDPTSEYTLVDKSSSTEVARRLRRH